MNAEQMVQECTNKIKEYENMLKLIPETSILGQLCIKSYIRKEKRKIERICEDNNDIKFDCNFDD